MDFSINAGTCRGAPEVSLPAELFSLRQIVQAVDRALIVDVLPTGLQPPGNAWAATMLGAGSVFGFFVFVSIHLVFYRLPNMNHRGNIDLPHLFPRLGGTQLEVLVIFTSFFLLSTHAITAWCVKEEPFTDS